MSRYNAVPYLDCHGERVDGRTEEAAAAAGIFQGVGDLSLSNKHLELCTSLTSQEFLTPTTTSLAKRHSLGVTHVRLQGL